MPGVPSFLKKNAFTLGAGLAGIAKTLLEQEWVFTAVPLADQNSSSPLNKVFYMLALVAVSAVAYGMPGAVLDYQREQTRLADDKTRPLLQMGL